MGSHVAVDATKGGGHDSFFLLGIAIEVGDETEFNNYYRSTVADFFDHYGFSTAFPVLKTKDITNHLPSFKIGSGIDWLAEKLAANPGIERITVSVGWYDDTAQLYGGQELNGIQFASDYLHQYFPIVTLWRHHETNDGPSSPPLPDTALVDNVTGRITDSWGVVGNEFDLNLVPNGDMTYPSISTADIIASKLRTHVPSDSGLDNYRKNAYSWLIENRHESEPFVRTESVNEEFSEYIVPRHPHSIHAELHYPHPVVFIYDTALDGSQKAVLQSTRFYNKATEYAFDNRGSVVNLEINEWPFMAESGDILLHTADQPDETIRHLKRLTPDLDVEFHSLQTFVEQL